MMQCLVSVDCGMATAQHNPNFSQMTPPRRVCIGSLVYDRKKEKIFKNWLKKSNNIFIRPNLAHFTGNYADQDSIWSVPLTDLPLRGREALEEYAARIRNTPELWLALPMLANKILGCTCRARNACHGDVLVQLFWEKTMFDGQKESTATYSNEQAEEKMEIDEETNPPLTWANVASQVMLSEAMGRMTLNN